MRQLSLDLYDIQGDVLEGLPKNCENFIFYKIVNPGSFKQHLKHYVIPRITDALQVHERELAVQSRTTRGYRNLDDILGLNLGFTKDGVAQLFGVQPNLDPAFEKGADHRDTIKNLNDPSPRNWLKEFISDRIDGILLVTGRDRSTVTFHSNDLLRSLSSSIKLVYSEIGTTRPGAERGHEHFGFLDGISQPGIRGLTTVSDLRRRPDAGLPGQDLFWPGEFVFGYPGQHSEDPYKEGPAPEMAAPWMRNGSYMVFRRLEQKVPEFRRFVREQAARLGMDPELLGRPDGRPLEERRAAGTAPLRDDPRLGADEKRNNDFEFGDDPEQRKCPYAAHIRKVYPRDDTGNEAEVQRHRIIRDGIPFGPELAPGETTTKHSRGLMFVCYQTSIERQFEYIQRQRERPRFCRRQAAPRGGGR